MANFCYGCTSKTLGEEGAKKNDFAGIVRHKEKYYCFCDGCGWVTVDKDGKRVEEEQ